jgi:lysozyme
MAFIKAREGVVLHAYNDGTGFAIGYGNTYYEDGSMVKGGDIITQERADALFVVIGNKFANWVNNVLNKRVNQNQFDALVSYAYNRRIGSLSRSNLLKMVNANPDNGAIAAQFEIEWGSNNMYRNGLINRRRQEAELYFKPVFDDINLQNQF